MLQRVVTVCPLFPSTTLVGDIATTDTVIVVTNASNYPSSATILCEGDTISYTGKSGNTLTGVVGITPAGHAAGAAVWIKSYTSPEIPVEDAAKITLFFTCANRTSGNVTLQAYGGGITGSTANYNLLVKNQADANTADLQRIQTITFTGNATGFYTYDSSLGPLNFIKCTGSIDATGNAIITAVIEYRDPEEEED